MAEIARNCPSLRTVKIGAGTESRYEMAYRLLMANKGGQVRRLDKRFEGVKKGGKKERKWGKKIRKIKRE